MAANTSFRVPKLTIIFPGGDQLTSVLLEREKNTVIADLIERVCTVRAIEIKNIKAYNDEGKKIDTKQTVEQSGLVFIELIDKKNKNKDAVPVKSHIDDEGPGKTHSGKPDRVVLKIGQGVNLPLKEQLYEEEWDILQKFKAKNDISKYYSDEFIMVVLWSRKYDEQRTLASLQENLNWRKANGFINVPTTAEIEPILRLMCRDNFSIPGARNKAGGGIHYAVVKKDFIIGQEPLTGANLKKWIVWFYFVGMFYEGIDSYRNGITLIHDSSEYTWNHFDLETQKQMNVSTVFPMRIHKFLIINPPSIFGALIKICKTFMSAKIISKIETVKVKDIGNYVANDQLWKHFGGDLDASGEQWIELILDFAYKNEARFAISLE